MLRVRSRKGDGADAYSILVDLETRHIVGYRGSSTSWFDKGHVPVEELFQDVAGRRQRTEGERQRR
ncbi:hypothetical protein GCM10010339_60180 [Streptomyces alanosinicus]|uniref:Uncharacterized protein n=1 Tax=Streptomyces alanosinicus TaxID=68171 RepID=A0A918YN23_9ACTN|nr:hypothetical protein GCM10010339_60180 [Streptomyces alanosinicus]